MSGTVTTGWHSDPFGVHEARYFSADGQPTKLVRDRGVESYDEPPSGPDAAAAAMARMSAMPEPTRASAYRELDPYDRPPERDSWRPSIGRFAVTWMIAVAAAVAIVLAAQVLLRAPKPASPQGGGGATDVALVTQAATRTLKHGTVGFVLSARAGAGDTGTAVQGEGTADLGGKAATLNMIVAYKGGEMGMREILLDGTAYVAISIAGQSLLPTGKTWIAEQVPSQPPGTTNLIGGDPTAVLAALANQGITVRALGTKVVAGVSCTGYAVTAPGAQGTITVWINPQHLVREITANATFQLSAGGASASTAPAGPTSAGSLDLTLGFSYSAGPVVATAPPPASTMSFAAFLKQLAQNPAYRQLGQSGAS